MKSFLSGSELIPSAGNEDARRNIARSYFSTASLSHIPSVPLLSPLLLYILRRRKEKFLPSLFRSNFEMKRTTKIYNVK
jgi:hypothetical protein